MISNEELDDIVKIFKSLEEPGSLIKAVGNTIKSEAKKQTSGFLSMLLRTIGAGL